MRRTLSAVASAAALSLLTGSGPGDPQASPTKLVDTYLGYIAAGHTQQAVQECFDVHEFAHRVLGEDLAPLDAGRLAYVDQLSSIALSTFFDLARGDSKPGTFTHSPYRISGHGAEVTVSFTLARPAAHSSTSQPADTAEERMSLVVHRTSDACKIVEIKSVTSVMQATYAKTHPKGEGPIEFMEHEVAELLRSHTRASMAAHTDAALQKAAITADLAMIRNSVELYQAEHGKLPDLEGRGWKILIDEHLLSSPLANPVNKRSAFCAPDKRSPECGWTWNQSTGEVGACFFDEAHGLITPNTP